MAANDCSKIRSIWDNLLIGISNTSYLIALYSLRNRRLARPNERRWVRNAGRVLHDHDNHAHQHVNSYDVADLWVHSGIYIHYIRICIHSLVWSVLFTLCNRTWDLTFMAARQEGLNAQPKTLMKSYILITNLQCRIMKNFHFASGLS